MWGGVSGHAGLFSNASEVAVILQMLANGGFYGGRRYFEERTVRLFTSRHPLSLRRGIGFDMKQLDPRVVLNMAPSASSSTFGHLGFTGTCAWVDPEEELIFVFLSNRTYPTMENKKFTRGNFRPRVQEIAYKAITD